eukprot:4979928-Pyramimonas_sp.AAC.1
MRSHRLRLCAALRREPRFENDPLSIRETCETPAPPYQCVWVSNRERGHSEGERMKLGGRDRRSGGRG